MRSKKTHKKTEFKMVSYNSALTIKIQFTFEAYIAVAPTHQDIIAVFGNGKLSTWIPAEGK